MNMVRQYYAAPALQDRITAGLAQLGKPEGLVTCDELAPLDEFHLGGHQATQELIQHLRATENSHILDAGSGLGGPARRLAQATGCRVTGVDLSADFCSAGTYLNQRTRLADRVTLQPGDVTNLADFASASFDGAWTMHVSMNIADKAAFYGEVARVLKPGSRFVSYDIFSTGKGGVHYPVPWAPDESTSHLTTVDDTEQRLATAGFSVLRTEDTTADAFAIARNGLEQLRGAPTPPPLGLHLVLGPTFLEIVQTLGRNIQEERVRVAAIVAQRIT